MAKKVVKDVENEEVNVVSKGGRKKSTFSKAETAKKTKSAEKKVSASKNTIKVKSEKKSTKSSKSAIKAEKSTDKTTKSNVKADTKSTKTVKATSKTETKTTKATSKTTKKPATSEAVPAKKVSPKLETSKKTTTKSKTRSKASSLNGITAKPMLPEYYDLPYRYNETIVKILAQTPTTLFVYWDISDSDRSSLISMYNENFFYETRPILIVHNITMNYSFEIEINDFANSWYIRTQEPNCNYVIELGRRFNNQSSEYVFINSSNNMISPNDHVLFEKANLGNILFKNVKTNKLSAKDFGSLRFINNIDRLYGNIYDVYSALYNDELFSELSNPSSGEFNFKR